MTEKSQRHEYIRLEIDDFLCDYPELLSPFGEGNRMAIADAVGSSLAKLEDTGLLPEKDRSAAKKVADRELAKIRFLYMVEDGEFDVAKIGREQKSAFDALIDIINGHIQDMEISDRQLSDHDTCINVADKLGVSSVALLGMGR